jgi:nucleotide-binding universal stress UspA family protein
MSTHGADLDQRTRDQSRVSVNEPRVFTKVIVGVDEHPGSRDAIALANDLMAEGGELTLAHVHPDERTFMHSSRTGAQAAARERSLTLLGAVRESAAVKAGQISIASPSVGRGLHELAEHQHADLLVMGSCRRGLVGRVFVSDDTRDALNAAPCAVAVAPAGYSERTPVVREIGVAYDGSPESRSALTMARGMAMARGAKLSAFQAIALPSYYFAAGTAINESITLLVEEARERIAALGDVEPHAAYGTPAEELTVYSASLDLLLIGSRGYGPIGRMIHGSTSQQLARTARCPLIVLTRTSTTPDAPDPIDAALAA